MNNLGQTFSFLMHSLQMCFTALLIHHSRESYLSNLNVSSAKSITVTSHQYMTTIKGTTHLPQVHRVQNKLFIFIIKYK